MERKRVWSLQEYNGTTQTTKCPSLVNMLTVKKPFLNDKMNHYVLNKVEKNGSDGAGEKAERRGQKDGNEPGPQEE